jgi:carbonic anhydrase
MEQSPIDLDNAVKDRNLNLDLNYFDYTDANKVEIKRLSHTVEVTLPTGQQGGFAKTSEDGNMSDFVALQFHFHSPSEHTVKGRHMDLEMHIVHTYADGSLGGVIGVLFDRETGGDGKNLFVD